MGVDDSKGLATYKEIRTLFLIAPYIIKNEIVQNHNRHKALSWHYMRFVCVVDVNIGFFLL